jgi:hypothetical protein
MATLNPTIQSVNITKAGAVDSLWEAEVFCTVAGTYDQGATESLEVLLVPAAIENAMKNGKTVTLIDAMPCQTASKTTDPSLFMSLSAVSVSTTTVNAEITDEDFSTELAAAAVPGQDRPFGFKVVFTVA